MTDLLPCPFCASHNTMLIAALGDRPGCDDCYATTETVEAWNRRAPAGVPREPTMLMLDAGCRAVDTVTTSELIHIWRAMWDAAPKSSDAEDAARYRWLRDIHTHHTFVTRFVGGATIPRYDGKALDDLIDAARKDGK